MFNATRYTGSMVITFGRRNGMRSIQSPEPLTMDALRDAVPSVFAGGAHESRSDRYTYIPTSQIVEHLTANGFGVFSAMQGGSRDESKRGFTKHLVRFRPTAAAVQVGDVFPEICLVNSHDGTSAYRLLAGLFRLVCSNGLVASQAVIEDVRIPHSGRILADVAAGVENMRARMPALATEVHAMQSTTLTPVERTAFANAALVARYGETDAPISADQVLTPRRREDRADDLWTTLNVVQESLIRGGHRYVTQTRAGRTQRRLTGAVNSVDGTTSLNRALWTLADEMRKIKGREVATA